VAACAACNGGTARCAKHYGRDLVCATADMCGSAARKACSQQQTQGSKASGKLQIQHSFGPNHYSDVLKIATTFDDANKVTHHASMLRGDVAACAAVMPPKLAANFLPKSRLRFHCGMPHSMYLRTRLLDCCTGEVIMP
jgi:hypothetical protein